MIIVVISCDNSSNVVFKYISDSVYILHLHQKFFVDLGFDREAVCTKGDGMLIIQPVENRSGGGEFAEQILTDLIAEGFSGQELLDEFKSRQAKVRPAVESILEAARAVAHGEGEYSTYEDIFGSEE